MQLTRFIWTCKTCYLGFGMWSESGSDLYPQSGVAIARQLTEAVILNFAHWNHLASISKS